MSRIHSTPLREFCLTLPGATEDVKWGAAHCFSVGGRLFAMFELEKEPPVQFKCDEEDFDLLLDVDGIIPAPYAARAGWVSVTTRKALSAAKCRKQIVKSYELVFAKLTKKKQREIRGE